MVLWSRQEYERSLLEMFRIDEHERVIGHLHHRNGKPAPGLRLRRFNPAPTTIMEDVNTHHVPSQLARPCVHCSKPMLCFMLR
jgi:hypothetical protein